MENDRNCVFALLNLTLVNIMEGKYSYINLIKNVKQNVKFCSNFIF